MSFVSSFVVSFNSFHFNSIPVLSVQFNSIQFISCIISFQFMRSCQMHTVFQKRIKGHFRILHGNLQGFFNLPESLSFDWSQCWIEPIALSLVMNSPKKPRNYLLYGCVGVFTKKTPTFSGRILVVVAFSGEFYASYCTRTTPLCE